MVLRRSSCRSDRTLGRTFAAVLKTISHPANEREGLL